MGEESLSLPRLDARDRVGAWGALGGAGARCGCCCERLTLCGVGGRLAPERGRAGVGPARRRRTWLALALVLAEARRMRDASAAPSAAPRWEALRCVELAGEDGAGGGGGVRAAVVVHAVEKREVSKEEVL